MRRPRYPAPGPQVTHEEVARALPDAPPPFLQTPFRMHDPDAVTVEAIEGRRGITLEVRTAPGDMGRVIGRRGRTAASIRTVVRAAATKDHVDVDVDFVD